MKNLLNTLYGMVFGVANVIPGVSGGTMLIVFGCYDKVCDALSLKISKIKKNIIFLIFFGIGAVLGILGFSFVISYLFENFPIPTNTFFIGLILGSVPLIIRNATVKEKFRAVCIVPFVLALALVVCLAMLESAGTSEPYKVTASETGNNITVAIENLSDRTVNGWTIQLENGSFDYKYNITGAQAEVHTSITEKIKSFFGRDSNTDIPNQFRNNDKTAVIEPHGTVSFTYDKNGASFDIDDFKVSLSYSMDGGFFLLLLLASFAAAVAMIIPGVSGSFIMVLIGTYSTVIGAIKSLDIIVLIPVAIGVVLGLIFGARLISMLMNKFSLLVYSAILGLVVGSVYAILPTGIGLNFETLIGVLSLVFGAAIALIVGKHTKVSAEE